MLKNNLRYVIRAILALGCALAVNYFSFSQSGWLPLATMFVMLTAPGSPIFQGILRYIYLVITIGIISWAFSAMPLLHARIYDVTLGAIIGVCFNVFVFPDRIDLIFREAVSDILKKYQVYLSTIIEALLTSGDVVTRHAKCEVEESLVRFPAWMYKTGFDIALQKGYRFFAMKINEIGEVLFSMNHLVRYPYSKELIAIVEKPLKRCLRKNAKLTMSLEKALYSLPKHSNTENFYPEITLMEKRFKKMVPLKWEIVDVSKDYVYLVEFIYHLRELQDLMNQLAESLRLVQKLPDK